MYTIEKNISIPPKRMPWVGGYPFSKMVAGDSFSFPMESVRGFIKCFYVYMKTPEGKGTKWTSRVMERGVGRIWRIE